MLDVGRSGFGTETRGGFNPSEDNHFHWFRPIISVCWPIAIGFWKGAVVPILESGVERSFRPEQGEQEALQPVVDLAVHGRGEASNRKRRLQFTDAFTSRRKRRSTMSFPASVNEGGLGSAPLQEFLGNRGLDEPSTSVADGPSVSGHLLVETVNGSPSNGVPLPMFSTADARVMPPNEERGDVCFPENPIHSSGTECEEMGRGSSGVRPSGSSRLSHPTSHSRLRGGRSFSGLSHLTARSRPRGATRTSGRDVPTDQRRFPVPSEKGYLPKFT